MVAFELPASVRKIAPLDLPLVFDAWMKAMADTHPYRHMPRRLFYKGMKREIEQILMRSETYLLVSNEDPTQIYSFLCCEEVNSALVIHFAYTKSLFSKMGLMKRLILHVSPKALDSGCFYTALSPALSDWRVGEMSFAAHLSTKYQFVFNPFLKGQ